MWLVLDGLSRYFKDETEILMSQNSAHFLMLVAALIWGSTFIAQTTGMDTIGPLGFTAARYAIGALVVLPLALWEMRRTSLWQLARQDRVIFWQAIGLGVLMFGGIALQQTALKYTQIANAAFLTALYVPTVPLMGWALARMPIARKIWPAIGLSLFGTYLLSGNSSVISQWGDFLVMISALFWGGHIYLIGIITKKFAAPFQLSVLQSIVCMILAGIPMAIFEQPALADFQPQMIELLYAGGLSVGGAYTLQLLAQRYSHATTAAFILSLESVFAAIAGWVFLGETLGVIALTGCAFIFLAVCIADVISEDWMKQKLHLITRPLRKG